MLVAMALEHPDACLKEAGWETTVPHSLEEPTQQCKKGELA
jgi:hypothetical protein